MTLIQPVFLVETKNCLWNKYKNETYFNINAFVNLSSSGDASKCVV